MSPLRHRHIPYAYPKGKKVPKGRGRSEIRLSSLNTSEKCSGWHRQAPHHPSDGLSYPQDSFIAVHRAAQHPRLPGQGGGKSNSKQEADPTFFQHSRAGVDGSGQQHLQASAVDLKSLISHGLWGVWLGRKAKNSKRTNSANLSASNLNRSCPGPCPRPWRRGWLRLDNIRDFCSIHAMFFSSFWLSKQHQVASCCSVLALDTGKEQWWLRALAERGEHLLQDAGSHKPLHAAQPSQGSPKIFKDHHAASVDLKPAVYLCSAGTK